MPSKYDPEYHKRYAESESGRAARLRAKQKWLAKRKGATEQAAQYNPQPLAQALAQWRAN